MPRSESQSGEGHQAHAGPLDGLPEGIAALPFPEKDGSLEEMTSFFDELEDAIGEACGG